MARVSRTVVIVGCAALLIVAALSDQRVIQIAAISAAVVILVTSFAMAVVRANRRIEADLDELRQTPREPSEDRESDDQRRYGT